MSKMGSVENREYRNTGIQEYTFTTEDTEGTEEKTMVSEFMRLSRIHSLTTRSSLSLCSL